MHAVLTARTARAVRLAGWDGRSLRLVPKVRPEPALGLLEAHPLAGAVVLDLVAAEAADREVARLRMREVDAADGCSRRHREGLSQLEPDSLGSEEIEDATWEKLRALAAEYKIAGEPGLA